LGLASETLHDKVWREAARIWKSDTANQQAIAYLAYATIIRPENI
jgi:hypothetical protein